MNSLVVSEIFGPTFQGEGPSAGRLAMFLRLGGCNLTCLGCDTPYTWRFSEALPHRDPNVYDPKREMQQLDFEEIVKRLSGINAPLLVVTGGEPLLQAARLTNLLVVLDDEMPDWRVEIETNGTRRPTRTMIDVVDQFNVSPKLSHWGNCLDKSYKPDVIDSYVRLQAQDVAVAWKFVCVTADDVREAGALVEKHGINPRTVWIMPEATTPQQLLVRGQTLRDPTLEHGFNFTSRLHVALWPDVVRGV